MEKNQSAAECELKHYLFVKSIGALNEGDLREHFSKANTQLLDVEILRDGKNAILCFEDSATVRELINQRQYQIKNHKVFLEPYKTKPQTPTYWDKQKLQKDEQLQAVERDLNVSRLKTFKISEQRSNVPKLLTPGKSYEWNLIMTNEGSLEVHLYSVKLMFKSQQLKIDEIQQCMLRCGDHKKIKVTFCSEFLGTFRFIIMIKLRGQEIPHHMIATVGHEEDMKLLQPVQEYVPYEPDEIIRRIIPAFPPERATKSHYHTPSDTQWVKKLEEYPIPKDIQKDVDIQNRFSGFNPWNLRENYVERFHLLLWVEEAQQRKNIRKYDLREVTFEHVTQMEKGGKTLFADKDIPFARLQVPGLAEKRPSVLYSDSVYAWIPGTTDVEYEGWVYQAEKDHVVLIFCPGFQSMFPPYTKFNVRFTFNRMSMRLMHRALETAKIDLVWPIKRDSNGKLATKVTNTQLKFFDTHLNPEQQTSVSNAVRREHLSPPFLLFGAFGTGKTRTIIEMIRQITVSNANARLLVCAPSNSAVDSILETLAPTYNTQEMFRLYAFNRAKFSVQSELLAYTYYNEQKGIFELPDIEKLYSYKIILTTCNTSGNLYGIGIGTNHFTHIILDEAAQLMETEALIPLSMADFDTRIIMAGDDKQLGVSIQSESAKIHKLDFSIMERISTIQDVYQERKDSSTCVELVLNYRSHPKILDFPSRRFYKGLLKSAAPKKEVESLQKWKMLKNPNFPFLFYGIEGEDLREGDSPSFFNRVEAVALVKAIKNLLDDKEVKIKSEEIGVITPYYKQVQKIRLLLRTRSLSDIKVGTPEEFQVQIQPSSSDVQGAERKAIFVSTVRSSRYWENHDRKYTLGYLAQPKRLNTSISRAVALLVIVGDPYALFRDPDWRALIEYCQQNNSCLGPSPTEEYLKERGERDKQLPTEQEKEPQVMEPLKDVEPIITNPVPIGPPKKNVQPSVPTAFGNSYKPPMTVPMKQPPTKSIQSPVQQANSLEHRQTQILPLQTHSTIQYPVQTPQISLDQPKTSIKNIIAPAPSLQQSNSLYPAQHSPYKQTNSLLSSQPTSSYPPSVLPGWRIPGIFPPTIISPQIPQNNSTQLSPNNNGDLRQYSPVFNPNPSLLSATHNLSIPGDWTCVYFLEGKELISYLTGLGCPSIIVKMKPQHLKIEVSIFGMEARFSKQQHIITVDLETKPRLHESLFMINNLHSLENKIQHEAKLMISFPPDQFDRKLINVGRNKHVLVITAPKLVTLKEKMFKE